MTQPKRTSGAWYLVGAGLIISALTMGIVAFSSMRNGVEGMNRLVAPGQKTVTLPAGISTLFVEERSMVEGKVYEAAGDAKPTCKLDEAKRRWHIAPANGEVSYDNGDYAGRNTWDVEVAEAGDYTLVCEADKPVVIAIGRGIGSAGIVLLIGVVPAAVGLGIILFVFLRRRRAR